MKGKKSKQQTTKNRKYEKRPLGKITSVTVLQSLYLTGSFYLTNDLIAYASACAFGFLFSFVSVVMMILVILIRFLHASPDTVTAFLNSRKIFSNTFDLQHLVDSILSVKRVTNFEVLLGLAIIWMARRFFSSVMSGMHSIFKRQMAPRPVFSQIIILVGEAIIVILATVLIFGIISFKTIRRNPIFEGIVKAFPTLLGSFSSQIVNTLPLFIIFVIVLLCYKEESGTKPSWGLCIVASAACTFSFWVFQRLMGLFINVNRYNLLYGVLSNVIVILLEVYFFFMMFLFFAQFIFVFQFFDELLLGELYVLPDRDDTHILATLKRILFINPDYLIRKDANVIKLQKGQRIYSASDEGTNAYYIVHGNVEIVRKNSISYLERGKFFGEEACILNEPRKDDAIAHTDVELVQISGKEFLSLLDKNPAVSRKALS